MSRVSVAAMAIVLALPDPCHALRGEVRKDAPAAEPVTSGAVAAPTAPPVWVPPETAPPVLASPLEVDAGRAPMSVEGKRALAAFERGEHKKVRTLLEKRARAGKATTDEARLVSLSCAALSDKACVLALRPFVPQDAP